MDSDIFSERVASLKEITQKVLNQLNLFEKDTQTYYEENKNYYRGIKDQTENLLVSNQNAHETSEIKINNLKQKIDFLSQIISLNEAQIQSRENMNSVNIEMNTSMIEVIKEETNAKVSVRDSLRNFLGIYEKRLGLEICPDGEATMFKFKHIVENVRNDHFVSINCSSQGFGLSKCVPFLPEIHSYLQELNAMNDLSRFLKQVRLSFQGLYNS